MVMNPYPYQYNIAKQALNILQKFKLVYLAMEERTGKTLISLLTAHLYANRPNFNVLIIVKKSGFKDWNDLISNHNDVFSNLNCTLINYHSLHKLEQKLYDLIILDEAHNYISSVPKPSITWRKIKPLCKNKPIIYLSATPFAQGYQLLYHQLALSSFIIWHKNFTNFYTWYYHYALRDKHGRTDQIYLYGRYQETYKKIDKDKLWPIIQHLFITKTRKELEYNIEPVDKIHYIELSKQTKNNYNTLLKHKVLNIQNTTLVTDTIIKLRCALHMLEGGGIKVDDKYIILNNTEKIDYIIQTWGDKHSLVIMYNYIVEGKKLASAFKNATLLQSTSFAESVSLAEFDNLVIYSQDFSTARHIQRRARQVNKNRIKEIIVHFLLTKKGISEQVYNTVSKNKQNYTDRLFYEEKI